MNGSTDIYLTSPEGTFRPLFFFSTKTIFGDLEKSTSSRKKANFKHFA